MANPLTFLLPFRHHATKTVLVVQSGPIELALAVAARLRTLFPGCRIEGLVRDNDTDAVGPADFDRLTVGRWEERVQVVREDRTRRYNAVAVLLSGQGSRASRLLPYLIRTDAILMFNDHLDYFPLNLARISSLAQHVSGHGSVGSLIRWGLRRALIVPAATLLLIASTVRIHAHAMHRRLFHRPRTLADDDAT